MALGSRTAAILSREVEADSRNDSLGLQAEEARLRTLREHKQTRPKATNDQYIPRQEEFKDDLISQVGIP